MNMRYLSFCIAVVMMIAVAFSRPLWAANPTTQNSPLVNQIYKADLKKDRLTGKVGEEIIVSIALTPPTPPQGFFVSVNMKALKGPHLEEAGGPKLLTGFPNTSVVFSHPGNYTYAIIVTLVAKSSCGGVNTNILLDRKVQIKVTH